MDMQLNLVAHSYWRILNEDAVSCPKYNMLQQLRLVTAALFICA